MNGCNHKTMDDDAVKGYYFYIFLYRGSKRLQAGVFSGLGLGYDMVCRAVLDLGLRQGGYTIGFDSYYTGLLLLLQLRYWGINAVGTISAQRVGLGKFFVDLKKRLKKDKDPQKPEQEGYDRGYFINRCVADDENIVVTVQKDSKVMLYASNFISMTKTTVMKRQDRYEGKFKEFEL